MLHSIIIPHRNRAHRLKTCLASIITSARLCNMDDYEIIIVDGGGGDAEVPWGLAPIRFIFDRDPLQPVVAEGKTFHLYSKTRALNIGMACARGDVLSFVDVDAMVGKYWMTNAPWLLAHPEVTRLCYRVCNVPAGTEKPYLLDPLNKPVFDHDAWFAEWDKHGRGTERYVSPAIDASGGDPAFGNSQFSITRKNLAGLRCNEEFVGAGWEDFEFIRRIWRHHGDNYQGVLWTGPHFAMLHFRNEREPDWYNDIVAHDAGRRYAAQEPQRPDPGCLRDQRNDHIRSGRQDGDVSAVDRQVEARRV